MRSCKLKHIVILPMMQFGTCPTSSGQAHMTLTPHKICGIFATSFKSGPPTYLFHITVAEGHHMLCSIAKD